ncbi:MAG: efflux RND transporter periplasmic adaptor subunit [Rhodocyclaceae bacterium]|jgi:membrane fusion protein (multidrug efflux system)|nr:efflux RND transporter periplasmic adaptor subunit [Rhodocyclaceae bacterium]
MSDDTNPATDKSGRNRALTIVATLVLLLGALYAIWWALDGRFHESTDDAYVAGNLTQITPHQAGVVVGVLVNDTEYVEAGRPLVRLDGDDARVAREQAEAELARAVRDVQGLFANDGALSALVAQRESELAKARDDFSRRQGLAGTGAVAKEDIEHAAATVKSAEAALAGARDQLTAVRALTAGTSVETHPTVARAAARLKEAYLAEARTTIVAPVAGFVARRAVQVGQRVAPGAPLMAVVPLDTLWVDANFKEGQLRRMRIGQPVTLTADMYGGKVEYHGRIRGLGAGTGAVFSLLPAQNATGNWIKVVQRVPVRIALDPKALADHPLRVGLSMLVSVDTRDQEGKPVAEAVPAEAASETAVYADSLKSAEGRIQAIVRANLARTAR